MGECLWIAYDWVLVRNKVIIIAHTEYMMLNLQSKRSKTSINDSEISPSFF